MRGQRTRQLVIGVAVVLAVVLSSAPAFAQVEADNGESSQALAFRIADDATAAAAGASSAHVVGTFYDHGKKVTLDVVAGHGNAGGTITAGGLTFDVVVSSPDVYLRGDAKTWKKAGGAKAAKVLANRWVKTTADDPGVGQVPQWLDLTRLVTGINYFARSGSKDDVTQYHGQAAVPIHGMDSKGTVTWYIAATGTPYLLGVVGTDPKRKREIRFTEYGTATAPTAPTDAVTLDELRQSSTS